MGLLSVSSNSNELLTGGVGRRGPDIIEATCENDDDREGKGVLFSFLADAFAFISLVAVVMYLPGYHPANFVFPSEDLSAILRLAAIPMAV